MPSPEQFRCLLSRRTLAVDSRVSQTPIIDKGFAAVRKVGDGLYATISDLSKGITTACNGGFLVGKDAALLIEGFATPGGASFQHDILRSISQVPVKGALDTHYHFDHSMGNSFYGSNGIPLWAHATASKRIVDNYSPLQGVDKNVALAPYEKRIADAKSDTVRQHAQTDLAAVTTVFGVANSTVLALPNHPTRPGEACLSRSTSAASPPFSSPIPATPARTSLFASRQQNVVYTGDLLFNGWYPVCFDEKATISGWRDTLKKFAAFDKDTIFVPGHGQVCGQEGIATIREVFDDIAAQAEKMHKAGVPAEEAADRYVVPDKFKNFPIFAWGFTIGPAITKLYSEWGAK